ncbi:MAG: glycoside hydrolase family 9 protein [Lewinellaceae bacterium]|nr:glycoside hydrolase family 9 protein [Lewinellaceae bacterium]
MKASLPIFLLCLSASLLQAQSITQNIHIDQFGYLPCAQKVAVLANPQLGFNATDNYTPGATLQVVDASTAMVVFSAAPVAWNNGNTHFQSGDKVWWFDFSALSTPGEYYLLDPINNLRSYNFNIDDHVYEEVLRESVRAFYYQRCGVAKSPEHGGNWNDEACHHFGQQDVHCTLVTDPQNAATSKDLSGGWHDAGDYNKYVNFSHEPLHDLLYAYENNPGIWGDNFNIPESGNGVPDILDEIKVELDWLMKMQLADGSCLMKVSVTGFEATSPPSADLAFRRYGKAEASATRAVASVFAHAAIVYKAQGSNAYATTLLNKAELAWSWIKSHPSYSTYNNAGFSSANPEVATYTQDDYLACAAVYLFAATGNTEYRDYFDSHYNALNPIAWGYWYVFQPAVQDAMLYYANLPTATSSVANDIKNSYVNAVHFNNADLLTAVLNKSDAYRAFMKNDDYVWGNNKQKSYSATMYQNLLKYGLNNGDGTNDSLNYVHAADGYLHFLHGVNPINQVMLTNMYDVGGDKCANEIYHAWFYDGTVYDNALSSLYGPPPGIVPGGMNPGYSPDPAYSGPALEPPLGQPIQKSYKDWNSGWPENSWEITENSITYQGAYVNMLSRYVGQVCGSTSSLTNDPLSSKKEIRIFPNPSRDFVTIIMPESDVKRLEIFNSIGQKMTGYSLKQLAGNALQLNISSLPRGLYYASSGTSTVKFLKE